MDVKGVGRCLCKGRRQYSSGKLVTWQRFHLGPSKTRVYSVPATLACSVHVFCSSMYNIKVQRKIRMEIAGADRSRCPVFRGAATLFEAGTGHELSLSCLDFLQSFPGWMLEKYKSRLLYALSLSAVLFLYHNPTSGHSQDRKPGPPKYEERVQC